MMSVTVLSVSDGELRRLEVLRDVDHGGLPVRAAAQLLGRSDRQVWRLLKAFRSDGAAGLISKKRGRPSNRNTAASVRAAVLWIVRQNYADFGPTLAAEKLAAEHGFSFSSETLRKWMIADGLWFVPLEQTVLTETIAPRRRTALFARYSVIGSCATALGVLAAAFPDYATAWTGCSRSTAMQLMFGLYAFLGLGAFLLYRPLSPAVEVADRTPEAPLGPSKKLVYGMAALFGMDSFGTGFLVQSLLALWLYQAFQVSVTTTATILFWTGVCSAVSYLVAVPIAERIGLINTMVFTHLPSNILLILTPLAPNLATAIALLLVRSALSQMDVPTRTSYVMAVVTPPERPAAASITAVPKTFAWAAGSMISGYLLTLSTFGWPLLIGGVIKGVYDILLLIKFQKVRPPEEAGAAAD
jgi:predicted MFS family arabinose efflux permease/transposase